MDELPPKYIWHLVARFLALEDIVRLSATCTHLWGSFCDQEYWKHKALNDFRDDSNFVFMLDETPKSQYVDHVRFGFDKDATAPFVYRVVLIGRPFHLSEVILRDWGANSAYPYPSWKLRVGILGKTFEITFTLSECEKSPVSHVRVTDAFVILSHTIGGANVELGKLIETTDSHNVSPTLLVLTEEEDSDAIFASCPYRFQDELQEKINRRMKQYEAVGQATPKTMAAVKGVPHMCMTGKSPVATLRKLLENLIWRQRSHKTYEKLLGGMSMLRAEYPEKIAALEGAGKPESESNKCAVQ